MKRNTLRWFGVKTLYRVQAVGRPRARDRYFDASLTLVEERVVVFRARSHDEAIRKAEREAKEYAGAAMDRNPYGQRRKHRFLGALNSYEMLDPPAARTEVYSDTFLVRKETSDHQVIAGHLLFPESKALSRKRRNFLSEAFNRPAGA